MRIARKPARFEVRIVVDIKPGAESRPLLRLLCGDTLFLNLPEGHSARWTVKRIAAGGEVQS